MIRTLKAIATVLQTAVDLHLYRSPRRCVRDSNPRGFYTQTVFKTAPSTCRTRNINLSFQIVRPPSSHFLIINQNQSGYLAQSRVIETQSCRITRLSRSVPHLVNLLCRIGEGEFQSSPKKQLYGKWHLRLPTTLKYTNIRYGIWTPVTAVKGRCPIPLD